MSAIQIPKIDSGFKIWNTVDPPRGIHLRAPAVVRVIGDVPLATSTSSLGRAGRRPKPGNGYAVQLSAAVQCNHKDIAKETPTNA